VKLKANSSETKLTDSQITSLSETLNSMIEYTSTTDCKTESDFTGQLANDTIKYLDTISQSQLDELIAN